MNVRECPNCHVETEEEVYKTDAGPAAEKAPYWAHSQLRLGCRLVIRIFCPQCQEDIAVRGDT